MKNMLWGLVLIGLVNCSKAKVDTAKVDSVSGTETQTPTQVAATPPRVATDTEKKAYAFLLKLLAVQLGSGDTTSILSSRAQLFASELSADGKAALDSLQARYHAAANLCVYWEQNITVFQRTDFKRGGVNCPFDDDVWLQPAILAGGHRLTIKEHGLSNDFGLQAISSQFTDKHVQNEIFTGYVLVEQGKFTLADGTESDFYWDYGRNATTQNSALEITVDGLAVEIRVKSAEHTLTVNGVRF